MSERIRKLVLTALFCALTTVATIVIAVPVAATQGYINMGDSVILATSALLGPVAGALAGGIGSAFADIFLGYAQWAPFTLIIKGCEGLVTGLIAYHSYKIYRRFTPSVILGFVFGVIIMIVGYFFAAAVLYSTAAAFTDLLANVVQGAASLVIGTLLFTILSKIKGF